MVSTNKELRAKAREELKGKWKNPVLVALINLFICVVINLLDSLGKDYINNYFKQVESIIWMFLNSILLIGYTNYFLKFCNQKKTSIKITFSGFDNFWTSIGISLWANLWIIIWILPFIIILYYLYIVSGSNFNEFSSSRIFALLSLFIGVTTIIKLISYSTSFYIINDNPKIGVRNALRMSKKITHGYKMKIFLFSLSFAGWLTLGALPFLILGFVIFCFQFINMATSLQELFPTINSVLPILNIVLPLSGIGLIWVFPYMQVSLTKLYEELKREVIQNGTYSENLF